MGMVIFIAEKAYHMGKQFKYNRHFFYFSEDGYEYARLAPDYFT
jgi:hypothetical protein